MLPLLFVPSLTLDAVAIILHACGFTPSSVLGRTWIKTTSVGAAQHWRVAFVHPAQVLSLPITLWQGSEQYLTKLGTFPVPTESKLVDLLAERGWLL